MGERTQLPRLEQCSGRKDRVFVAGPLRVGYGRWLPGCAACKRDVGALQHGERASRTPHSQPGLVPAWPIGDSRALPYWTFRASRSRSPSSQAVWFVLDPPMSTGAHSPATTPEKG